MGESGKLCKECLDRVEKACIRTSPFTILTPHCIICLFVKVVKQVKLSDTDLYADS